MSQMRVLILAYTVAASDPRVLRQINALKGLAEVTVASKAGGPLDVHKFVDIGVRRHGRWRRASRRLVAGALLLWRLPSAIALLKQVRVRRLSQLRQEAFDVVVVNDVECLPAAYSNGLCAARVVLDVHEFSEDQFPQWLPWRLLVRPTIRRLAREYIPRVDGIMTVSEGLATLLREVYGRDAAVAMSADDEPGLEPTPVCADAVRMVHVGSYSPTRGLDTLCEVADLLGEGYTLDFYLVPQSGYKQFRQRWEAHPNITFHQPVPMATLASTINRYDIGVYSLPPTSLNNMYALPNKFFQFLQGGVAIATGPSPEMARIVEEYRCGVVAEDFSAEALAAAVSPLTAEDLWRMKLGSNLAAQNFNGARFAHVIRTIVLPHGET